MHKNINTFQRERESVIKKTEESRLLKLLKLKQHTWYGQQVVEKCNSKSISIISVWL